MDDKTKRAIALWRLGVLGALVSARLEHGDRQQLFAEIAARVHQMPDGRVVELSPRTVESWYYAHKRGGFEGLFPCTRSDCGRSRAIAPDIAELILRVKREKPRRSIRRIIRMLERARKVRPGELARSSVHRLLKLAGVSARPLRGPSAERRSFIAEHAGDLWVGDALHGPRVLGPDGGIHKSYLLSQIDNATRYIVHSYFALSEGAAAQEYGLKQATLKYGIARAYYVDRGSAYVAHSLRFICADLGIHLLHAGVQDAEAKGVIERWHRTWREEVGDELPDTPLPLAELNAKHWAWLGAEYHARVHETTSRAPRDHMLAEANEIRPVPRGMDLDEVFLHREERVVRKDGTVRWGGGFLEVRADLGQKRVELRFDPTDETARPRVFIDGRFACDTVPLDRLRNMTRQRRRIAGEPAPDATPSGLDPLALIEDEHYRRTRPAGAGPDQDDDNDQDQEP
ncbi:MAG TPA: DDE-type integrase/transposase/recombinase [Alphaproteobacteria bacterium]|nr:DDE-type integrase/transposase/recombinase [Alphaproteobacteria bacterium]